MLHGLGGTSNAFQPQMDALRAYRVVRIDLPGSGRSPLARRRGEFCRLRGSGARRRRGPRGRARPFRRPLPRHHPLPDDRRRAAGAGPFALPLRCARRAGRDDPRSGLRGRAELARREGMAPIADQIVANALSASTRSEPAGGGRLRARVADAPESGGLCPHLRGARQGDRGRSTAHRRRRRSSSPAMPTRSIRRASRGRSPTASPARVLRASTVAGTG